MRLKSYLRGLGIGIIVTALILHFSQSQGININDKVQSDTPEVIETNVEVSSNVDQDVDDYNKEENPEEAEPEKEILINEDNSNKEEVLNEEVLNEEVLNEEVLGENPINQEEQEGKEIISEEQDEQVNNTMENDTETSENIENMFEVINQANNANIEAESDKKENADYIEITIVKGDDSGTVARKLFNAGIVDNASEFDYYLMQHGYDKKISVGTVKIQPGLSWADIAQKLAGY